MTSSRSKDGKPARPKGRAKSSEGSQTESEPLEPLLDEVASALVLVDLADDASLVELVSLLERAVKAGGEPYRSELSSCRDMAAELQRKLAAEPQVQLERLGTRLSDLQNLVRRGATVAPSQSPAAAAPAPSSPTGNSPDWVDDELMKEFASNQRSSLEELESELLAVEKGLVNAVSTVRRRVHGLKGEAGVVGLDALADVYHAIEDVLAAPKPSAHVSALLNARDWLVKAVETYAQRGVPEVPAEEVARELRSGAQVEAQARPEGPASMVLNPAPAAATAAAVPLPPVAPQAPAPELEPASSPVATESAPATPAPMPEGDGKVARDADTVSLFSDFLHESEDGIAKVDQILIDAEKEPPDVETVNVLFRVFHSIKGVSSFLECRDVTEVAHATETLLNQIRKGGLDLRGGTLDLIFNATEAMRTMLGNVRGAVEKGEVIPRADLGALLDELRDAAAGRPVAPEPVPVAGPNEKLGEILTKPPIGVPQQVIQAALDKQQETGRKLGEELLAQGVVQPKDVAHALRAQAGQATKIQETIKIDIGRVDQLVEIIGELVVVESMVVNAPEIAALTSPRIRNFLNQLNKITRDAQDIGMRMRMVPVRGVFQKMARMVRDLSHKSGKAVRIELSGEGAEMDRSMVEQVADPLVHMIRNAVDHGIEGTPEDRLRAGKDRTGTVRLGAYHEGDHIVISIADDGRGLDRDAILRKAQAQGLVREGESLSDSEIHQMIFLPGFSTAKQVTEISGRGVGMDVVKRNVEAMRGRIAIETVLGKGTTFRLLLPLTLAIIDGMLVRCGEERYIIPTLSIIESMQPTRDMLVAFASKGECINVRDEILPLMRLDRLFGISGAIADPTEGLVVILEAMGKKAALLVDQVVSQQKVVIKSMGSGMQHVECVSGAAILSDGTVGLILNAEQLVYSEDRGRQRGTAAA